MVYQMPGDHFRFLDLLPELRNKVYEMVFADDNEHELDVYTIKACLPDPSITRVSRQIYQETSTMFHIALNQFWENHIFIIDTAQLAENYNVKSDVNPDLYKNFENIKDLPDIRRLPCITTHLPAFEDIETSTWRFQARTCQHLGEDECHHVFKDEDNGAKPSRRKIRPWPPGDQCGAPYNLPYHYDYWNQSRLCRLELRRSVSARILAWEEFAHRGSWSVRSREPKSFDTVWPHPLPGI